MHLIPLLTKVGLVPMSPLRQKGYREDHDQQDSHASEREGAGPLKGNILRALSFPKIMSARSNDAAQTE
jgi:hypothetical protein